MKNKSNTNMVRRYCNWHKGEFFDVCQVHWLYFRKYPLNIFRKYVSRLVEEGILQPVSKGFYFIGDCLPENLDDRIMRHFTEGHIIHSGDSLLYELGIIKDKPKVETLRCSYPSCNRNIRNFYFKTNGPYVIQDHKNILELIDLVSMEKKIDDDDMFNYLSAVGEYVKKYSDKDLWGIKVEYNRIVYSNLANLLDSLHISNRVREWYESQHEVSTPK